MGAAVEAGNFELARRLAHAFKGGAGTVGLVQLQAAAAELEVTLVDALAGSADTLNQSHRMATLTAAWDHAQAALKTLLDGPSLNAPPPAELA
jgi:HPt (histidine-containing phosphotransfer) domain-containing protein